MLKLLVDESSGRKLADSLKESGYDVRYVGDFLQGAEDSKILEKSQQESRILITNDTDFGELIFKWKKPSSGVILLRLKKDNPANRLKSILLLIKKLNKKLENAFTIVSEDKIRRREL